MDDNYIRRCYGLEGKLVRETEVWRKGLEGKVNSISDNNAFQHFGENWGNRDRPVVIV